MALHGWDLAQLVQQRRVRFLVNFLDHLPRNSYYQEARALDRELALELYLNEDVNTEKPKTTPPHSQFSLEAELLTNLVNEVKALRSDVASLTNNKTHPAMLEGPRSAYADVESELNVHRAEFLNQWMDQRRTNEGR